MLLIMLPIRSQRSSYGSSSNLVKNTSDQYYYKINIVGNMWLVGTPRIELGISEYQSLVITILLYPNIKIRDSSEIQTHNLQIRNLLLYSVELWSHLAAQTRLELVTHWLTVNCANHYATGPVSTLSYIRKVVKRISIRWDS